MLIRSFLTLCFMLLSFSCGHKSSADSPDAPVIVDLQATRNDMMASWDESGIPPCDLATFAGLFAAYGDGSYNFPAYEVSPGFWVRNPNIVCYPEESKSETSFDVYLSVLHYLWAKQDYQAIQRIVDAGSQTGYQMGEGPAGVTSIMPLVPLMKRMLNPNSYMPGVPLPAAEGYRAYLVDSYYWLKYQVTGNINEGELLSMQSMAKDHPDWPFIVAMCEKFNGSEGYPATQALLRNMDLWKDPNDIGAFGWGSSPNRLHYIITFAVMTKK